MISNSKGSESRGLSLFALCQRFRIETLIGSAFVIVFILLILRATLLHSPIFGGDEYAYFVHGKYYPNYEFLYQYDPMLQGIENRIYFLVENLWFEFDANAASQIGKLWHVLLYCLGGAIIFFLLRAVYDLPTAAATTLIYLMLPMSAYTATLMPEVDFQIAFYLLATVFILLWPSRPIKTALLSGILVAVAFFIKPNAIAFAVGVVVAMSVSPLMRYPHKVRWRDSMIAIAVFTFICYAGIVILWRLLGDSWALSPLTLVGKIYSGFLRQGTDIGFMLNNLLTFAQYLIVHVTIFALIFPMSVTILGITMWKSTKLSRGGITELSARQLSLFLFILTTTVAFILMISNFTVMAGVQNQFEANRIHGRYLLCLLPFFIALMFPKGFKNSVLLGRLTACVGLMAALIFVIWIIRQFKIFPWDYPELFAFYVFPNHYQWSWSSGLDTLGYILIGLAIVSGLIALMRPVWTKHIYVLFLVIVLAVGQFQYNYWLFSQSKSVAPLIDAAQTARQLLGPVKEGEGAIVGDDRYGTLSYILMGFGSAQHVIVKEKRVGIANNDVPKGLRWILAAKDFPVQVPYLNAISIGPLTMYQLVTGQPLVKIGEKQVWHGDPIRVELNDKGDRGLLEGFNDPEPWGSWTAKDTATIMLPVLLQGDGVLRFSGWTVPENVMMPLRVRLGKETLEVKLSPKNEIHEIKFHLTEPVDRVYIDMPAYRANPWERALGVALQYIEITKN